MYIWMKELGVPISFSNPLAEVNQDNHESPVKSNVIVCDHLGIQFILYISFYFCVRNLSYSFIFTFTFVSSVSAGTWMSIRAPWRFPLEYDKAYPASWVATFDERPGQAYTTAQAFVQLLRQSPLDLPETPRMWATNQLTPQLKEEPSQT